MRLLTFISALVFSILNTHAQLRPVTYETLDGVSYDFTRNSLEKLTSAPAGWSSGSAFSSNVLFDGTVGIIDYIVENRGDIKAFGLSDAKEVGVGLLSLDYAFYVNRSRLYIIYNGKVLARIGNAPNGTILRLRVTSDKVQFLVNGRRLRELNRATGKDFYIGSILYNVGAKLEGMVTDFKVPLPPEEELDFPDISTYYVPLTSNKTGRIYTALDDVFKFKLIADRTSPSRNLNFKVFGIHREDVTSSVVISSTDLIKGTNYFDLQIDGLSEGTYRLEAYLANEKTYTAYFSK